MQVKDRIDGIMIGRLTGFDGGTPLVQYPANPGNNPCPARSVVALSTQDVGAELALQFEDGVPEKPLILGRIVAPDATVPEVISDGDRVRVTAQERLELRCGKASIIMEADGHVTIRGSYLVNHATAANRIRGGSVNIN